MPYWAVLLCLVTGPPGLTTDVPWPNRILEDLVKNFQSHLDKLKWRELRLYVRNWPFLIRIATDVYCSASILRSSHRHWFNHSRVHAFTAFIVCKCFGRTGGLL